MPQTLKTVLSSAIRPSATVENLPYLMPVNQVKYAIRAKLKSRSLIVQKSTISGAAGKNSRRCLPVCVRIIIRAAHAVFCLYNWACCFLNAY
jgi:hypothetical protein